MKIRYVEEAEFLYRNTYQYQLEVLKVSEGDREPLDRTQAQLDHLENYLKELDIPGDRWIVSDQVEPAFTVGVQMEETIFDAGFVRVLMAYVYGEAPEFRISVAIDSQRPGLRRWLLQISLEEWVATHESRAFLIEKGIVEEDGETIREEIY